MNRIPTPAHLTAAIDTVAALDLSVIIPVFNEAENVGPLHDQIAGELASLGKSFEIIWVDDGSTDGTREALRRIAANDPNAKVIELWRNYGQTAAMMAGIDHSRGGILMGLDGDGQNDPADFKRLLQKLDEGFDVVSGWRQKREDRWLTRRVPSQLANWLISRVSGVKLHDYGCSLKAYRREILDGVKLYGEMHRFIPIYAVWQGAKIVELPVQHHPRRAGKSKYGLGRVFKVVLDLLVVQFLNKYLTKPIYVFGGFGMFAIILALVTGVWAVGLKLFGGVALVQTPLPLIAVMSVMIGVVSVLMGLLAEIVVRVYFEAQTKDIYRVRARRNFD
jgi:glycosyltransferase involved in cell wall biosynthesis